jgi:ADP-dependent NAD(P)H-hydrate dehydratase / NAD(P)H-hydrate epimerase
MNLLLTTEAIRGIETAYNTSEPDTSLMVRAAEAAARVAIGMHLAGGRVLVMAGPGNNGGDAWVVAKLLQDAWHKVTVLSATEPQAPEARKARHAFMAAGGAVTDKWPLTTQDLIIDGLFGIGLSRPPSDEFSAWIDLANQSHLPILALDVPSGLNADTGTLPGACIRAKRTITFIADKPGLHTGAGPDVAGEVDVAGLGTQDLLNGTSGGWLLGKDTPPDRLPVRNRNSHKGHFGAVGIIGGARGMAGASVLTARAALFSGAGKVFLASIDDTLGTVDWHYPEIMFRRPRELLEEAGSTVLVVGPGMGTTDLARNLLESVLKLELPLILDADALNLIGRGKALQTALKRRTRGSILTPHPAEAARLLGMETTQVNADRVGTACALADRFSAIVVLKGSGSIIAGPEGQWFINATGNPGMAAGGMGDVLAGVLGAVLAQQGGGGSFNPLAAARLAVWAHGKAADQCVLQGLGPVGLTPGEVLHACRAALNTP